MATRADVMKLRVDVETAEARRELDRFDDKVDQTAKKAKKGTAGAAGGFKQLRGAMLGATAGAATVTAAIYTLDKVMARASRIDAMSRGFESLARSIGETAAAMGRAGARGTMGLMSQMDIMQQANSAMTLGVVKNSEEFGELTNSAVRLGRALGLDARMAIESLVTGIGRQSRLMLDNLGIIVKAEEAQRNYAESIGTTVAALTQEEKAEAFRLEAIRQLESAVEKLGPDSLTVADAWAQIKVNIAGSVDELLRLANMNIGGGAGMQALGGASAAGGLGSLLSVLLPDIPPGESGAPKSGTDLIDLRSRMNGINAELAGVEKGTEAWNRLVGEGNAVQNEIIRARGKALRATQAALAAVQIDRLLTDKLAKPSGDADLTPLGGMDPETVGAGFNSILQYQGKFAIDYIAVEEERLAHAQAINELADYERLQAVKARADEEIAIEKRKADMQRSLAMGAAGSMMSSLSVIFENNKAFAYASTIINTAEAVMSAAKTPPWPLGFAMAAAAAAMGAAQLATISRTRPGAGGGYVTSAGLPSGTGQVLPTGPQGGGGELHIFIEGAGYIQDVDALVRDISDPIQNLWNRGGEVSNG